MSVENFLFQLENEGFINQSFDPTFPTKYFKIYDVVDSDYILIYNNPSTFGTYISHVADKITIVKKPFEIKFIPSKFIPFVNLEKFLNDVKDFKFKKLCLFNLDCFA